MTRFVIDQKRADAIMDDMLINGIGPRVSDGVPVGFVTNGKRARAARVLLLVVYWIVTLAFLGIAFTVLFVGIAEGAQRDDRVKITQLPGGPLTPAEAAAIVARIPQPALVAAVQGGRIDAGGPIFASTRATSGVLPPPSYGAYKPLGIDGQYIYRPVYVPDTVIGVVNLSGGVK